MPVALIASAVVGAGATLYASSKASGAAKDAASQNAALQQQQYQQTRQDLSPYNQAGYGALSALQKELGLVGQNANGTPLSGSLTADQIAQIKTERPDVAAEAEVALKNGSAQSLGVHDVDSYVQLWYNKIRPDAGETYKLPEKTGQAPPMPAQPEETGRPELPRPAFTEAQPSLTEGAPDPASYFVNFETSPGYDFRLKEGMRNLNANFGARGLLQSGSALKGAQDYGQGIASSEYNNWWNQQFQRLQADRGQFNDNRNTGLAQYNQNRNLFNTNYNFDTARSDQNFNSDRAYDTSRKDTRIANLFQLTGMGQGAAGATANAGQNYVSGMTSNNNALASAQANAAISGANSFNNLLGAGVQAYGMYQNPFAASNNSGSYFKFT